MVCADRLAVRAMGKFAEEWRGKSREERAKVPSAASKVNEPWRRITGITADIEHCMDPKERRAGIRDLIDWIEEFVDGSKSNVQGWGRSAKSVARTGGRATSGTRDLSADVKLNLDGVRSPHPAFASLTSALSPALSLPTFPKDLLRR